MKLLLPAEETEGALDVLERRFSSKEDFRIVLLPVEASIPRLGPDLETAAKQETLEPGEDSKTDVGRIHREELYADLQDVTKFSKVYVVMVTLSSVVAAIGILKNNVAIIIGAMVIAPLLGPNVALSLATTLGDTSLGRMALKTNIAGVLIAFLISAFLGIVIAFDAAISEIVSRTKVGTGDVALALASGTAGAMAFTSGLPSTVIGVMVAVAILPPLVTCGLLIGAGNGVMAIGAMLLFLINIICVNLAGVLTFLIQGIRPLTGGRPPVPREQPAKL